MNEDHLQAFRDALKGGKSPDERTNPERIFLRGFNAGIEFAELQLKKILEPRDE